MKPGLPQSSAAATENLKDGLQLALETLTWLAAWVLIPVWLACRDTSLSHFLLYSIGSGSLLAFGVLVDRGSAFEDGGHLLWFSGITTLAIFLFGGTVFGLTRLHLWAAA